jgi:hypothetical protein
MPLAAPVRAAAAPRIAVIWDQLHEGKKCDGLSRKAPDLSGNPDTALRLWQPGAAAGAGAASAGPGTVI